MSFGVALRNGLPIGLGSVAALTAALPFDPQSLFGGGTPGLWYSPSDLTDAKIASGLTGAAFLAAYPMTALYQDAAGTTPVTALEQPVGKMLDKSGRGNHAIQSTSANRPVITSRKNMLTYTSMWSGSTDWALTTATIVTGVADPNGGTSAIRLTATSAGGDIHFINGGVGVAGSKYTTQVMVRRVTGTGEVRLFDAAASAYVALTLTSAWTLFTISGTVAGVGIALYLRCQVSGDVIEAAFPQLEYGSTATRYQRVGAATYGTGAAAGVADYVYDAFDRFDKFNGTNSSLATTTGGGSSTGVFICLGFQTTLTGAAQTIWSDRTGNTGLKLEITAANVIAFSGGNGASINTATGDAVALGTYYVVTALYDGVNLSVQLNSATPVTAACTLSAGTAAITQGANPGAASGFFAGSMSEVIYVKDVIESTARIAQTKSWVATKTGVTL